MKSRAILGFSTLLATMCLLLFSVSAMAQEEGAISRIVDIPNIENAKADLTDDFRQIFSDIGHLVYNESEMLSGASAMGIGHAQYWKDPELLKKVNKRLRHDALITLRLESTKRKDTLIVDVFNGFSAEKLAGFELGLKRKGKLSNEEKSKLRNAIHPLLIDINASLYPSVVFIQVDSAPTGASILRNGVEIGKTPYTYETTANPASKEQWVITLDGYEPKMQDVDLSTDQQYSISFMDQTPQESTEFRGKVRHGGARPIFSVGLNADVGLRSLESSVTGWTPISYSTKAYPVIGLDLAFYPFGLFVNNEYLAGLGVFGNFGIGFLEDKLRFTASTPASTSCKDNGNGTYSCDTLYSRFQFGVNYRLLLQKKDEHLNPNGMALDFLLGYNWSMMQIEKNPLYRGHAYQGLLLGTAFSSPLGLDALRAQLGLNFIYNVGFGNAQMIGTWGTGVDNSIGVGLNLGLSYDIWKGIFARLGYNLNYFSTKYKGEGCMNDACNLPTNSKTSDMYHEIIIGFGWMLY